MRIKFWGVRGSVPTPLDGAAVEKKIVAAAEHVRSAPFDGKVLSQLVGELPFHVRSTYGGNTSCVEVEANGRRIVLDMGTGLRPFGNSLFPAMFSAKGLDITFLLSHVHWDHIQGLPFFGPLYVNAGTGIRNTWTFHGGTDWQKDAEVCLRGQMDAPVFPVSWAEIQTISAGIRAYSLHDMETFGVGPFNTTPSQDDPVVVARKLNHPQETYGFRISQGGKVVAYTTDNEPYDPMNPDPRLLAVCKGADLWITDCQYTKDTYEGVKGVPRHGWGHSYPEAVAKTAAMAGVKKTVLFHHDPASSDEQIAQMEQHTQQLLNEVAPLSDGQYVIAAYEGLEIVL